MSSSDLLQAIDTFHAWRRDLLLAGHELAPSNESDPELVLSSKMLKVFLKLRPEFSQHLVQLHMYFLEEDYTNRVKPGPWKKQLAAAEAGFIG